MTKELLGREEPRLFTPPLRKLTPRTTKGFEVIKFAERLGVDLLPWEKWFLKHALELLPDGTFRFAVILLLISRQNGKTFVAVILTLWFMQKHPGCLVLGTSTAQELAREPWNKVVDYSLDQGLVRNERSQVKRGSIDTSLVLDNRSRYKVGTTGRRGGRSLSVDLLLVDELREHLDWDGWNALTGTTTASPNSLTVALSNAGDDRSIVLNALRATAIAGEDETLGLFEYSAPDGCELDDLDALRQANPALGHTITLKTLEKKRNTMPANGYRTEHLCQRVETENPAIDKDGWSDGADPDATMEGLRSRIVCGIEVSMDQSHVSLIAAALLEDGRVRAETVEAWDSVQEARAGLPFMLKRIKPRKVAWIPNGPAAVLATDLRALRNSHEVKATEVITACQSLAEQIEARRLLHSDDPMLTAQVVGCSKQETGDGWRFTRKGVGNCDAVYALAIAVQVARASARSGNRRILTST